MTGSEAFDVLDQAWSDLTSGAKSFPMFVMAFEAAVRAVEEAGDPVANQLRRIWGLVEIINALALDEGIPVSSADLSDTADLVRQARELLRDEP